MTAAHFARFPTGFGCLVGSLGVLCSSCAAPLPPAEYRAYLADPGHGLRQATEAAGDSITCAYRPTELLVLQDLVGQPGASPAARDSLARAYAGKTYCTLTFSRHGQELENQYLSQPQLRQRVLDYLNQGIAADAFLATAPHDSVAAAASFYAQQHGLSGHSTVVLVFATPHRAPAEGFRLTLRGQALGLPDQHFAFASRDLAALPALRYD